MTTTPTPRTDERANNWESIDGQWVNAEFARWLERELAAIEIQRNEWKAIAAEALASFRCTQRPEIYPEGHWSRRAQSLLENTGGMARELAAQDFESPTKQNG